MTFSLVLRRFFTRMGVEPETMRELFSLESSGKAVVKVQLITEEVDRPDGS